MLCYLCLLSYGAILKVSLLSSNLHFSLTISVSLTKSRIDEKVGEPWDLPRVAVDALGAAMLVTIILDLWRLFLGPIVSIPESKQCAQPGLAWFQIRDSVMQNKSV